MDELGSLPRRIPRGEVSFSPFLTQTESGEESLVTIVLQMSSRMCLDHFGSRKPTPNTVSEGVWNFGAGSEQRILSLQDIAHELFMALDLDGDAGVSWAATWLQLRLLFKTP